MRDTQIEAVLMALRRVMRAIDLHSRDLMRTTGLTVPQLLLLQTIQLRGKVSIGELAQDMSLSQATVTSIIDRLEDRAYVLRQKAPEDRRKVHVLLTDKGLAVVKDAPVPLQDSFVAQFQKLSSSEQEQIIVSLQRVAAMMQAQDLDVAPVLDAGALDRKL